MPLKNKYKVNAFVVSLPRLVDRLLRAGVVDLVLRAGIVDGFFFFGGKGNSLVKGMVGDCEREEERLMGGTVNTHK